MAASEPALPASLRLRQRLRLLAAAATLALASQTPAMIAPCQLVAARLGTAQRAAAHTEYCKTSAAGIR